MLSSSYCIVCVPWSRTYDRPKLSTRVSAGGERDRERRERERREDRRKESGERKERKRRGRKESEERYCTATLTIV